MDDKHVERLIKVEQISSSNTKRIDTCEQKIDKLENTYQMLTQMDYRMGKVENAVERIDNKLENHDKQKGLKWDKLIDYLFYAILAYALFKLGLK